jgi:replicative DNA helicase
MGERPWVTEEIKSMYGLTTMDQQLKKIADAIEVLHTAGKDVIGIPTGIKCLDETSRGLLKGHKTLILPTATAASSLLCDNILANCLSRGNASGLYISTLDDSTDTTRRMMSLRVPLEYSKLKGMTPLRTQDWPALCVAINSFKDKKFSFYNDNSLSMEGIYKAIERTRVDAGAIDLVAIPEFDKLQGMLNFSPRGKERRRSKGSSHQSS